MTDRHEEFRDLCAAWALGCLDDAERVRFEQLLSEGGEEARALLAEFTDAAAAMSLAAPPTEPPAAAKERMMEEIRRLHAEETADAPAAVGAAAGGDTGGTGTTGTRGPTYAKEIPMSTYRTTKPNPLPWLGWAAAAVFAFLFFTRGDGGKVEELGKELAMNEARKQELADELADERAWSQSIASPSARAAFLASTPEGDADAKGWALYDPGSHRAILVIENLKIPDDKDLQLWALRDSGPANLGLIGVKNGRAVVKFDELEDPESLGAFAVSLEEKGGSANPNAPTGPVVLVGELGT